MTTTHQLTIHPVGGDTAIRRITADPDALAQEIHRHVRGLLGGNGLAIHLDGLTGAAWRSAAHVADFELAPAITPETPPRAPRPLHDYTAATIDSIVRTAINAERWRVTDREEHFDALRYAVVEHLLTADTPPTRRDLVQAALAAADNHVLHEMHHHGWSRDDYAAGPGGMPSFQRYWTTTPTPSPEVLVVDSLARRQIWPLLTRRQKQAIQALADTGNYRQAARMLSLSDDGYGNLLSTARTIFRAWWHEGEAPSGHWRQDQRVGAYSGACRGIPRLTESQVEKMRDQRAKGALLRDLATQYSVGISTVSRFLRGNRRPAPDPIGGAAA